MANRENLKKYTIDRILKNLLLIYCFVILITCLELRIIMYNMFPSLIIWAIMHNLTIDIPPCVEEYPTAQWHGANTTLDNINNCNKLLGVRLYDFLIIN